MFNRRGKMTFKSQEYLDYQNEIRDELILHENMDWPFETEQVFFSIVAGLSNRGADIDNVIKPLLDTYQSIYSDFNDNKVYGVHLVKDIVPKGEEYLSVVVGKVEDEKAI